MSQPPYKFFFVCVCVCEERICLLVFLVVFVCLKNDHMCSLRAWCRVCLRVGYRHSHSPGLPLRDTVAPWRQYPWLHRRYHFSLNYKYRYWGHLDTHALTHRQLCACSTAGRQIVLHLYILTSLSVSLSRTHRHTHGKSVCFVTVSHKRPGLESDGLSVLKEIKVVA